MGRKKAIKIINKQLATHGEDPPFIFLTSKDEGGKDLFEIYDTDERYTVIKASPTPEMYGYLDLVFRHLSRELSIQHYMRYGYEKS